jgi:hypothetical protein
MKRFQGDSRLILSKDTKALLSRGDVLRFSDGSAYEVTGVYCGSDRFGNVRSVSITVRCQSDGRYIYYTPSSGFYGAEIIKGESIK